MYSNSNTDYRRSFKRRCVLVTGIASMMATLVSLQASEPATVNDYATGSAPVNGAYSGGDAIPDSGCPRAHCDQTNSDHANLPAPAGPVAVAWHNNKRAGERSGSGIGLGCSAAGDLAVCTYRGSPDAVVAYNYDGDRLWSSGELLGFEASASAPLILANGDTIVPDGTRVVRFDSAGGIVWNTVLPYGGAAISPVLTDSSVIVLATRSGPIYAVDSLTGNVLATRFIRNGASDPGVFVTQNTPAVAGNRLYISMHHELEGEPNPANLARLVAVDVDRDAISRSGVLTVAWRFPFGAVSRSSPLVVDAMVFFDAERPVAGVPLDYHLFGVRDEGTFPNEIWRVALDGKPVASFAHDPRGGFWHFLQGTGANIIRRSEIDGSVLQALSIGDFVGDSTQWPTAAMTLAEHQGHPTMITASTGDYWWRDFWVMAIDLVDETAVWTLNIDGPTPCTQFPLVTNGVDTRTVFSTMLSGARAVGPATAE